MRAETNHDRKFQNPELDLHVGDMVMYRTVCYSDLFRDGDKIRVKGRIVKIYKYLVQVEDEKGRKKELSFSDFYSGEARKL